MSVMLTTMARDGSYSVLLPKKYWLNVRMLNIDFRPLVIEQLSSLIAELNTETLKFAVAGERFNEIFFNTC